MKMRSNKCIFWEIIHYSNFKTPGMLILSDRAGSRLSFAAV